MEAVDDVNSIDQSIGVMNENINLSTEEDSQTDQEQCNSLMSRSHLFMSDVHSAWIRYGIPIYLLGVFVLLLVSDLASGISAEVHYSFDGKILRVEELIELNIFTSVRELWRTKSYAIAILITVASICLPYLKLILTMYIWVTPFQREQQSSRKREIAIEILDACSKWSLVDIFVLFIIMVGFRSTIETAINIDVYFEPKSGLSGFVIASIMSLVSSHIMLYLHRKAVYEFNQYSKKKKKEQLSVSEGTTDGFSDVQNNIEKKQTLLSILEKKETFIYVLFCSFVSLIFSCVGYFIDTLTFSYKNELVDMFTKSTSLHKVGTNIVKSTSDPNSSNIRFLQTLYIIVSIVIPICSIVNHIILYLIPMTVTMQKRVLLLSEINTAWNSIDVIALSFVFAIWQIPKISSGLVETGCTDCFIVKSRLKWTFAFTAIGSVSYMLCSYYLNASAHKALYKRATSK